MEGSPVTLADRESSRADGSPVELYLLRGSEPNTESALRAVVLGPGHGEFALGTTRVRDGNGAPLNEFAGQQVSDLVVSLNHLQATAPNVAAVNLLVAWHGDDLRMGECDIKPKVESTTRTSAPYLWRVGPTLRDDAGLISRPDSLPVFGGAPSDRSLYEAIQEIRSRGLRVAVTPIILLDIPEGNAKADPYGGEEQGAYPHRSKITCHPAAGEESTVDQTSGAATQVTAFFGTADAEDFGWNASARYVTYSGPAEWSYRRFVLHVAQVVAAAGGAEDFLLGSDLGGVTTVRSSATAYPAVDALVSLSAEVRDLLPDARISYSAGWREAHGHRPADGSGDVFFHLDAFWGHFDTGFVGIETHAPLSDWRDGNTHLDRQAGYTSIYETDYLRANIEGGEGYDWEYASTADRDAQTRTPITDATYGEPWVLRDKDMRGWWQNLHYNRPGGTRSETPTIWAPELKPIVVTAFGCAAVEKGANLPDALYDPPAAPRSRQFPWYSAATGDDTLYRAHRDVLLGYWATQSPKRAGDEVAMIEPAFMFARTWDVRPHPTFPQRLDTWEDADNYWRGLALNGRLFAGWPEGASFGPYGFTTSETAIVRDGITYLPGPATRSGISASGTLDKSTVTLSVGRGIDLNFDYEFVAYPPAGTVNVTIFQGHAGDDPDDPSAFTAVWSGRIISAQPGGGHKTELTCEPISSALQRPALTLNYQRGCPHALYGPECRASRDAATRTATVAEITAGGFIRFEDDLPSAHDAEKYAGGMALWRDGSGAAVLRTIMRVPETDTIQVRGFVSDLVVGQEVSLTLGCAHNMDDCRTLHGNILNYGGQPYIPLENPLGPRNQFF